MVGHLEHAPDVRGLCTVEEQFRLRSIPVDPVLALDHSQRHQSVQEISSTALVQPQSGLKGLQVLGVSSQLAEEVEFDRTQERLGRPEPHAELYDGFRAGVI